MLSSDRNSGHQKLIGDPAARRRVWPVDDTEAAVAEQGASAVVVHGRVLVADSGRCEGAARLA